MPQKSFRSRILEFADSTSCHGIGALSRSRVLHWRILWTVALLAAFTLLGYQISTLWIKYRSHPISTKVEVKNNPLPFPSVTICNTNPLRKSMVITDDPDIQALKKALLELEDYERMPDKIVEKVPKLRVPSTPRKQLFISPATSERKPILPPTKPRSRRRKRSAEKGDDRNSATGTTANNNDLKQPEPSRYPTLDVTPGSAFAEINPFKGELRLMTMPPPPTYTSAESEIMSLDYDLVEIIKNKSLDRILREAVQMESHRVPQPATEKYGHQAVDMIQWCRFLGEECGYQNFTRYVSHKYGNCWTFNGGDLGNNEQLMMKRSGTAYGLKLVINAEAYDYMPVLSSGSGVRVIIHPQETFPFAGHRGYPIPVGYETDIGVTVRKLDRLGYPYGICQTGNDFFKETGRAYDAYACKGECLHRHIKDRCGCYIYYRYDDKKFLPDAGVRKCINDEDVRCTINVRIDYAKQKFDCPCPQPCKEMEYLTTSALTQWPSQGFKDVLQDNICRREQEIASKDRDTNFTRICGKLRKSIHSKTDFIEENLLSLSIYFKHLNYESIIQEPAYPLTSFLSDMGGTMGLYAGISLLTGIEILALVCGLMKQIMISCRQVSRQSTKEKSAMTVV